MRFCLSRSVLISPNQFLGDVSDTTKLLEGGDYFMKKKVCTSIIVESVKYIVIYIILPNVFPTPVRGSVIRLSLGKLRIG